MDPRDRPPYDTAAPSDTMGVRHIELALRDLPFPATTREILQRAGAWRMPVSGAHFHTLAEYLRGVEERDFRSPEDVARAVARAHPELAE